GLGEAIVLGKVTPDRFVLDKKTQKISERTINIKEKVIATVAQDGKGQSGAKDTASLRDEQIAELAKLGLRVAEYFKHPCDIEWPMPQGKFYLLKARASKLASPATTASDGSTGTLHEPLAPEAEKVRQEEMAALKAMAEPGGTVWSRFNLSEILPEP